ncbi:MAG TPA: DUF2894 domain-containing protein [Paraburkholderia sp.]|nr:DUF2894 domain-containing protein [Paraburkholderia sp.]
MNKGETCARERLDTWRECGADRLDPVRFHFMEALHRRAAGHSGEARRLLDQRLSSLLDAYADDLAHVAERTADSAACEPARSALGELIDSMVSHVPVQGHGRPDAKAKPLPASWPELEMLEYFRALWSKVSTERQLRQSLEQVPGNAGPLNSSSLVHRSLSLMRELSPGYLQHFLSYVDALSWMEQIGGGVAPSGKDAPRAGSARKSARGKAR